MTLNSKLHSYAFFKEEIQITRRARPASTSIILRVYKATLGRKPKPKYTNLTHSPDAMTT